MAPQIQQLKQQNMVIVVQALTKKNQSQTKLNIITMAPQIQQLRQQNMVNVVQILPTKSD